MDQTETGIDLEFSGDIYDMLAFPLLLALMAVLLFLVYRTMQHPRLPLIRPEDAPPRAAPLGVLRYLVTTPLMMAFWLVVMLTLLGSASGNRSAPEVTLAAASIVGAARILAHVKEELAHEVAKTVPIAILGYILIGSDFADPDQFDNLLLSLSESTIDAYYIGLLLLDITATTLWFLWQRRRWNWRERREDEGKPAKGAIRTAWSRFRRIGYS